jgi:hypothetical protein
MSPNALQFGGVGVQHLTPDLGIGHRPDASALIGRHRIVSTFAVEQHAGADEEQAIRLLVT